MALLSLRLLVSVLALVAIARSETNCKKLATYNPGLLNSVPGLEERAPRVPTALKGASADVLCLQEFWFEQDISSLLKAVGSKYPHHYSPLHSSLDLLRPAPKWWHVLPFFKDRACSGGDFTRLLPFLTCLVTKGCISKTGPEQTACALSQCNAHLSRPGMNPACTSCVLIHAFVSVTEAFTKCILPQFKGHNRFNAPGLLVLSKEPLSDVTYTSFFPQHRPLVERGYIQATMSDGKQITCTHLSAIFANYFEYDVTLHARFGSYQSQNLEEIDLVDKALAGKDRVVLLGDMNVGPQVRDFETREKNLTGEAASNFEEFAKLGYSNPFLESDGRCSYCLANPLTKGFPNVLIDHVLLRGGYRANAVQRLFDSSPPLSDHYGVQVEVCDP